MTPWDVSINSAAVSIIRGQIQSDQASKCAPPETNIEPPGEYVAVVAPTHS